MRKSAMGRTGLLGSAAVLGLVVGMSGAQAYSTKFGDFEVTLDTTVSVGGSVRVADRETEFLPASNGGPEDLGLGGSVISANQGFGAGVVPVAPFGTSFLNSVRVGSLGQAALPATFDTIEVTNNRNNFDGSINGDDARLNWDSGDLISANLKATHDLEVKYDNWTVFARAVGFYDVILNDPDAPARSDLTQDGRDIVGRNYKLLDLYLSGNFNLGDSPANLRIGKQVISWGESTFILNGINVVNPIDVAAFRRPGSEIREGLIPVNAVYGSLGLGQFIDGLSVQAFYMLDFEEFRLDPAGSPFAGADIVEGNSDRFGNINRVSYISGGQFSSPRRNCDAVSAPGAGTDSVREAIYLSGLLSDPTVANASRLDCLDAAYVDYRVPLTTGLAEQQKNQLVLDGIISERAASMVVREQDELARDDGQWGVSFRYFAEDLNSTEFGFYAMNYHSRLPILSQRGTTAEVGIATQGIDSNLTDRNLAACLAAPTSTGCLTNFGVRAIGPLAPVFPTTLALPAFANLDPRMNSTALIDDPQNIINNTSIATAQNFICTASPTLCPNLDNPIVDPGAILTGAQEAIALAQLQGDSFANFIKINSVLSALQAGPLFFTDPANPGVPINTGAIGLIDGAEYLTPNSGYSLFFEYPEDIGLYGFSFNTTVLGWGVQGEISYRPDAPFQIDSDSITIANAIDQCAALLIGGNLGAAFEVQSTWPSAGCNPADIGNKTFSGVLERDMYTAQVGTTATFTGSDVIPEFFGADLGIFLTELGVVVVEDVESTWLTNDDGTPVAATQGIGPAGPGTVVNSQRWVQFQNTGCQGSDLPLGTLLNLDFKPSVQCRPTDVSAGYVLVGRLTYNNAFDTGFAVSPTIAFSHDFYGTTPSPYGNYLEDRMSGSFSLAAELNNNFRVNMGYTGFWGGNVNNKAQDQDFASFSASYSF